MKFSSKIEKCNLSPIRKFYPYQVECAKRGVKIYHLNIGQPDIATPPAYFDAVRDFKLPVLEYAPSPGIPDMIKAVQGYYDNLGIHYATNDIFVTTGGSEALTIALNCILDDGDEIIIPEPFYPNYNTFVRATGATIRPLTTHAEEGYKFAIRERIEPLINEHTRAILFTNPGNPTGTVLTPEELRLMADIAKEHNLFLIGDEVYREFVYGGARIGCMITRNKELQQNAMKFCQARLSVATLDQVASAALYTVGSEYFNDVRDEYRRRRDTIYRKLLEIPGVVCKEPKGAFYVMAKLPVDDTDKFQTWLLTEFSDNNETVMYAPGNGFYATPGHGVNEVRLAYVLKCEDIERAMDLLAKAIKQYNELNK